MSSRKGNTAMPSVKVLHKVKKSIAIETLASEAEKAQNGILENINQSAIIRQIKAELPSMLQVTRARKMDIASQHALLSKWCDKLWKPKDTTGTTNINNGNHKRKASSPVGSDVGSVVSVTGTSKRRLTDTKLSRSGSVSDIGSDNGRKNNNKGGRKKDGKNTKKGGRKNSKVSRMDDDDDDVFSEIDATAAGPSLTPVSSHPFWSEVEEYTHDPTEDDVKALKKLISETTVTQDLMKNVSLGRHYSEKWVEEDFAAVHADGDGNGYQYKNGVSSKIVPGLCTSRVLSALLEDDAVLKSSIGFESSTAEVSKWARFSGSSDRLEIEIQKCLQQLGVLKTNKSDDDDEIAIELQNLQQSLVNQNQKCVRLLSKLAQSINKPKQPSFVRQQKWKRPEEPVDNEIEHLYWKRQAYVKRNQAPPQDLMDSIRSALDKRESYLKSISLYGAGIRSDYSMGRTNSQAGKRS
eukprot:m.42579 g.42579  ORF g.42579 m.42579 type:complete len:465 (+) comp9893_c0_seq4:410-1804(+)